MITSEPYQVDWEACADIPRIKSIQLANKGKASKTITYVTHCIPSETIMNKLIDQPMWFYIDNVIDGLTWRTERVEIVFYSDRAVEFTLNGHVITFGNIVGGGQGWFIDGEPVRNIYTIKRRLAA